MGKNTKNISYRLQFIDSANVKRIELNAKIMSVAWNAQALKMI